MNNNNLVNIAKSLVQNDRIYGAGVILSTANCSSFEEYIQLTALIELCVLSFEKQGSSSAKLAIDKLEDKKNELNANLKASNCNFDRSMDIDSWRKIIAWVPAVTSSILDGYIDATYHKHDKPSEEVAYKALRNCSAIQKLSSSTYAKIERLVDLLSVPKLRELEAFYSKNSCDILRSLVLESLIKKAHTVNWEYYNFAQLLAKVGKHQLALENFKLFYEKALADNENNSIKAGLSGALNSVLYVENVEEYYEYFLGRCPQELLNAPELANIKKEVSEVVDSRRIFSKCKTSFSEEIGYHYFDLATVKDMYFKAIELVEVHPSYKLFYRLFKICAVLDKADEAKFWLKQSVDANVLLFKVGE